MKKIKVYVCDNICNDVASFWERFCISELKTEYEIIWDNKEPDYLIATEHIYYFSKCMKEFKKLYRKAKITLFWAGECIFPDMNIFDYAICWDSAFILDDRICRITPEIFEPFKTDCKAIESINEAKDLMEQKGRFCNFIYSNPNAHPMRDNIYKSLSRYKRVDSLGKHLNNMSTIGTGFSGHEKDATLLKENYKFSIASENASYKGYTSEKIMTSFQAHTIPIYWGNPDVASEYNEKAFINANEFNDLEELVKYVKIIDCSNELWSKMICEPMYTEQQRERLLERKNKYKDFFRYIFEQELENAKRRPEGYHPEKYRKFFFLNNSMWILEYQEFKRNLKNFIRMIYTRVKV